MNKDEYKTASLALAAAIQMASASKLQYVERLPDNSKALFVFTRTSDLDNIIQLFWQKNLPLDAFSYFETTRYIKSRLYEEDKI